MVARKRPTIHNETIINLKGSLGRTVERPSIAATVNNSKELRGKSRRRNEEYCGIKCKQLAMDHPDFGRHNKSPHDAKQPTSTQHPETETMRPTSQLSPPHARQI
jgi:hypothetical protein